MIKIKNIFNQNKVIGLTLLLFIAFVQFTYSNFYQNDKTTIAIRFVDLLEKNKSPSGAGMLCYDFDGKVQVKDSWAEEPPLFHIGGVIVRKLTPGMIFTKLYPVLLSSLAVVGLWFYFGLLFPNLLNENQWALVLMLAFIPIINIHFAKFVPDLLSFTTMCWSFYFYEKKQTRISWFFALISVVSKALAIFGFFFYFLGKFIFNPDNEKLSKRFIKYSAFGLTVLFAFIWFVVIKQNNWSNPFFVNQINFTEHTGGTNFHKAYGLKYWGRYLTFVVTRGVSWPIFLITIFEIINGIKNKSFSKRDYSFLVFLIGSPIYWLVIRAQTTDPWKTFYLIIPFVYFAFRFLSRSSKRIVIVFTIMVFLTSFSLVKYSFDLSKNFVSSIDKLEVLLACDYQESVRRAHLKDRAE